MKYYYTTIIITIVKIYSYYKFLARMQSNRNANPLVEEM